jgi:hypothetical protein
VVFYFFVPRWSNRSIDLLVMFAEVAEGTPTTWPGSTNILKKTATATHRKSKSVRSRCVRTMMSWSMFVTLLMAWGVEAFPEQGKWSGVLNEV